MFQQFQHARRSMLIATLLFLLLGIAMTAIPGLFIQVACAVIGGVMAVFGIVLLLGELRYPRKSVLTLGMGVLIIAVAIVIIANPQLVSSLIPLLFGILLLIDGVSNIRHAFGMRRYREGAWGAMLALGVITLALAVLILLHPYGTAELAFRIMGIALIYNALSDLFIVVQLHRASKKYVDTNGQEHRIIDVEARPVEDEDNEY